jgi:glucosyl-dolichyl phosphate glucuronosyltransferase
MENSHVMKASIVIVTRNRAADLLQTLEAMRHIQLADGLEAELVVVDNGSSDGTADVVRGFRTDAFPVRHVYEPRMGQTMGRNRGLVETTGEIILWTDDDVRPPADWLSGMCEPMARGRADAVCGGVRLAPHLLRPWMTSLHRNWLASTEWIIPGAVQSMVGANMAFMRHVLQRVPCFDLELGAGALGFGDDGLFASQLLAAGFGIHDGRNVVIEHHFEPHRLKRGSWLDAARRRGESHAYRGHHWEHWGCRLGRTRSLLAAAELASWRMLNREKIGDEGCDEVELALAFDLAMLRGHVRESRRPRNYDRHGLVKLH